MQLVKTLVKNHQHTLTAISKHKIWQCSCARKASDRSRRESVPIPQSEVVDAVAPAAKGHGGIPDLARLYHIDFEESKITASWSA